MIHATQQHYYNDGQQLEGFWDKIVDAANAVGSKVAGTVKWIPGAANTAAKAACNVLQHQAAQAGANLAKDVPNPYAQGASQAVSVGSSICSVAYPGGKETPQSQALKYKWDRIVTVLSTQKAAAIKLLQAAPSGAIQWKDPLTGKWAVALPKDIAKQTGLGAAEMMPAPARMPADYYGYVSAPGHSFTPYGINKKLFQSNPNSWYDVSTSEWPYLATWGVGGTHALVAQAPDQVPNIPVVAPEEGKKATTPFYKKWWFWTAVGVGVVGAGTTAFFLMR